MNVVMYYAPGWRQERIKLESAEHNFFDITGDLSKLAACKIEQNAQLVVLVGFDETKNTLSKLSDVLEQHTNVSIALYISDPTSNYLIECMKAGISDILTDYSSQAVYEVVEKTKNKFSHQLKNKVLKQQAVAVLASKGGDGATLFAANIATNLAQGDEKVLLVDLSLPFGDLDMYVTKKKATYDFVDVTNAFDRLDEALLESMVQKLTPNFHLIPSPLEFDKAMDISTEKISPLIDLVKKSYDYVVFDVGSNLDPLILELLEKMNFILVVLNRNLPSIRQANQKLNHLMSHAQLSSKLKVVLNGKEPSNELSLADIESALDKEVKQAAPYDAGLIKESILKNTAAIQLNPRSDFTHFISKVTSEIKGVEKSQTDASIWSRILKIGSK